MILNVVFSVLNNAIRLFFNRAKHQAGNLHKRAGNLYKRFHEDRKDTAHKSNVTPDSKAKNDGVINSDKPFFIGSGRIARNLIPKVGTALATYNLNKNILASQASLKNSAIIAASTNKEKTPYR